jgi:hypothetical protein
MAYRRITGRLESVHGITDNVLGKNTRELARLQALRESAGVYTIQDTNRELFTRLCGTWRYQAEWLAHVTDLPKVKDIEPPYAPNGCRVHQVA